MLSSQKFLTKISSKMKKKAYLFHEPLGTKFILLKIIVNKLKIFQYFFKKIEGSQG